ncbi:MAG: hypothetical protein ACK4F0_02850 [Candidatus Ratteibacteria bacterium]
MKDEIKLNGSEEEVFVIGENIYLSGIFKSEFIGIGKEINGNLKINGDFISAALNQKITLFTDNDFYSVSNKINFNGKTGGSFTCITRNLTLENSEIGGNLRIIGNNVILKNIKIKQKSYIYGEKIKLSGIFSDLNLHGKEIEIEKGTKIMGDLVYYSPEKIFLPDVEIKGKIEWKKPYGEKVKERTTILKKLKFLYSFFSLFFTYFFLLFITPNLLQSTTLSSGRNFVKSFFLGIFSIITLSFFILIFLITIVGVPTGLILVTVFASLLYLSRGFIFIYLARNIFYKFNDSKTIWVLSIFIGILIFNLISLNSTLKFLSNLIATPTGFGALLADRVKLFKKLREEKII